METENITKSQKPKRISAHIKEDKSKREFEAIIEPFFVTGWNQRDYGIDTVVEITSHVDFQGNVELESKCFLVQLKSTDGLIKNGEEISFSVPIKKILYWYNYNLPVAFVIYDLKQGQFYYTWINDELISKLDSSNPSWSQKKSVTIKIPVKNELRKNGIDDLKKYVLSWKIPSRRALHPGQYFELKQKGVALLNEYRNLTNVFNFHSINDIISNLEKETDQSIYRIALTGLSRVGKSSLINALLKKEVSPTGFFQTTGVPIQVIPGSDNKVEIYFHNKPTISTPFSLDVIKKYASQDYNEDNKEQVKLVTISVKNQNLERGVSLFDIPGLDDPNDDILEYTWQTIRKVNAIVYVIDATSAQNGGFIFKNEYKKHITTFSQSQDKVFLVFNKVDGLSSDKLQLLKERVEKDLRKHELYDSINSKVFYLSAEQKTNTSQFDSVEQLNDAIWSFLLKENKFGIIKLSLINQELFRSTKIFTQILNSRLLDNDKRQQLQSSIKDIQDKAPSLSVTFKNQKHAAQSLIYSSLDVKKHAILNNLLKYLKRVPEHNDLPGSQAIKKYLIDSLYQTLDQTNNEYIVQVNQLKGLIDSWIEENLKQVTEILNNNDNKIIDFTDVEKFESPQIDLASAWGMGIIGALAGLIIALPGAALVGGLLGFFGSLFTTAESRRAKRISRIMERSHEKYDVIFENMKNAYNDLINEHSASIDAYVTKKLTNYFADLQMQMTKLEKPIQSNEIQQYKLAFEQIEKFQERLTDYDAELRSYHFSK